MSVENDIIRIHERIDRVEDENKEIRESFYNTMNSVNENLSALNTKIDANDMKTANLCKAVNRLAEQNQKNKHDIEMHAAECEVRREVDSLKQRADVDRIKNAKRTIKEHPIISTGAATGIAAALVKIIELLVG